MLKRKLPRTQLNRLEYLIIRFTIKNTKEHDTISLSSSVQQGNQFALKSFGKISNLNKCFYFGFRVRTAHMAVFANTEAFSQKCVFEVLWQIIATVHFLDFWDFSR